MLLRLNETLLAAGTVLKPYSYLGQTKVAFFMSGWEDILEEGDYLFISWAEKGVPYLIENISWQTDKTAVISLADIGNDIEAQRLTGGEVLLLSKSFPKDESGEVSGESLIDFNAFSLEGEAIGYVKDFIDNGPQALLDLLTNKGKRTYIPFHEDIVVEIDLENKKIILDLPEGLLELNN